MIHSIGRPDGPSHSNLWITGTSFREGISPALTVVLPVIMSRIGRIWHSWIKTAGTDAGTDVACDIVLSLSNAIRNRKPCESGMPVSGSQDVAVKSVAGLGDGTTFKERKCISSARVSESSIIGF